ncbi:MAG TPA: S-4TM family putative pore-forming effector, partial [Candidatus Nitrosocosmicus sp.]|nr:S-4TM family putative pore-forming effector [Candidatus Nitrosocosmicus sp.]
MASIPHNQNADEMLRLLAAQRTWYGRAKRLLTFQLVVSFLAPCLAVFSSIPRPWVALTGLLAALLDALVLDPGQIRRREMAAKIQEQFDCNVLLLPWNKSKLGSLTEPEDIHDGASESVSSPELRDWYPSEVAGVPAGVARAICQRANVTWDARLRTFYRGIVAWVAAATSVTVMVVGLVRDLSVESMTISVVAPLAPLLLWSIREW